MLKKILTGIIVLILLLIILVGVWFFFFRDGDIQKTIDGNNSKTFFPVNTTFEPDTEFDESFTSTEQFIPKLRQISSVPTAGFISFEREATSSDFFIEDDGGESGKVFTETIFRYIERATGHLFETKESTLSQERLSNITIPKIQDAIFEETGNRLVMRYLGPDNERIESFVAELKTDDSSVETSLDIRQSKLEGGFLKINIKDIAINDQRIDYLVNTTSGATVFETDFSNIALEKPLFTSDLSQWIIQRPNENLLTLTTKADSSTFGFLFFKNLRTGSERKILGDISGLTTLTDPSGKYVLYSQSRGGDIDLFLLNTETNNASKLDLQTFPEKCIWSKKEEGLLYCATPNQFFRAPHPESWYKGIVSFTDSVWSYNVETNSYQPLLQPGEESNKGFDIIKPQISPSGEYFLFINKSDLTFWSLDVVN